MASQTKMIIITSNEDIIHQFSLNKTTNTHIIDLENDKQGTSITNNMINLAFLAELSERNSSNDQVYKRVLDSSDHNRPKPVKVPKKSIDLICTICGDRAIGFNYDALSCASCKAFFRRNANQPSEKLRCFTGQGQCSVAHEMRRKCPRCRLDRCFAMGMRKDFMISEEEKQRRRKRIEENRINTSKRLSTSESTNSSSTLQSLSNSESSPQTFDEIDRLLMDMDKDIVNIVPHESTDSNDIEETSLETLSVEDWMVIQSVQSSFVSSFQMTPGQCSRCIDVSDRASALITWSQFLNQIALRFIGFFRQIDEFESLNADDRFILVKYNLLPLFSISKCYNYRRIDDCCSCEDTEITRQNRQFFNLFEASNGIRELFKNLVHSLVEITEQDPTLLSLLMIILLFSQGLSMSEDEPLLKDSLAVNRAQSYYTQLLWNYMINKQGEAKTCKKFIQLLTRILRIQSTTKKYREFFRIQVTTSDTVNRIAPLMQTILHIS